LKRSALLVAILVISLVLLLTGIILGEGKQVFANATILCFSCIGIG